MVHIILSSSKGNGVRYFPFQGLLGLTPVKVEGAVIARRDGDSKPLPAKSITISVRCYESRVGRLGVLHSNVLVDYTQVLWSKPDGLEYADVADSEYPFRILLPVRVGGFSTATFVEYRCVWRVEAILNHAPITGVGSRQIKHSELSLIRYDLPPRVPPLPSTPADDAPPNLTLETSKPRVPKVRYSVHVPLSPIGPMDLVAIHIHLQPIDASVSFRSASATVERRLQLNDVNVPPSPPNTPSPRVQSSHSVQSTSISIPQSASSSSLLTYSPTSSYQDPSHIIQASTASLSSSNPTITPNTIYPSTTSIATETRPLLSNTHQSTPPPLPSSEPHPARVVIHPIADAESSGAFSLSDSGVWSKTLTLQWPSARSNSRWAVGETMQSELVAVKFFLRVKITLNTSTGTESIDLEEKELEIVATNDTERQLAISKYHEASSSSEHTNRSKSKSPRRSRRERDHQPPVPSPSRIDHAHSASSHFSRPSSSKNRAASRRPHTSAGPRDKPHTFSGERMHTSSHHSSTSREQHTNTEPESAGQTGDEEDFVGSGARTFRRWRSARPTTSESSRSNVLGQIFAPKAANSNSNMTHSGSSVHSAASMSTSSISSSSQGSDNVKEWEEELARIEIQSRRSSDMLGFKQKRHSSPSAGDTSSSSVEETT